MCTLGVGISQLGDTFDSTLIEGSRFVFGWAGWHHMPYSAHRCYKRLKCPLCQPPSFCLKFILPLPRPGLPRVTLTTQYWWLLSRSHFLPVFPPTAWCLRWPSLPLRWDTPCQSLTDVSPQLPLPLPLWSGWGAGRGNICSRLLQGGILSLYIGSRPTSFQLFLLSPCSPCFSLSAAFFQLSLLKSPWLLSGRSDWILELLPKEKNHTFGFFDHFDPFPCPFSQCQTYWNYCKYAVFILDLLTLTLSCNFCPCCISEIVFPEAFDDLNMYFLTFLSFPRLWLW